MPQLFEDPALNGIELGSPEWFELQRSIIASRPLVKATYHRWYSSMLADAASAPDSNGSILEIGSGSGYVKTIDPSVLTSDVVPGNADMVIDAQALPFADRSLRAILLTHVFHHIPDVSRFLDEAVRTLEPGGVVTMIDVAHTPFARLFFGNFHPEAYDHTARDWTLDISGPYGGANQALSWIVFCRDREIFESRYPQLRIECVEHLPWLGYLLSGGATRRNFIPDAIAPAIRGLDRLAELANPACALHWHIRLRKVAA